MASSSFLISLISVGVGLCCGWAIAKFPESTPASSALAGPVATAPGMKDGVSGLPKMELSGPSSAAASDKAAPLGERPVDIDKFLNGLVEQMKAGRPEDGPSISQAFERLVTRAQTDSALRSNLLRRYKSETDVASVNVLATVIASFPPQEIKAMALQMSQGDAGQRANAFRLMSMSPTLSASSHATIQQALNAEQDVRVLSQAVAALGGRPLLNPQESQATVARLAALAEHSDRTVRSESLRVLAQWDKTGESAEPQLYRALAANDPDLRADAVYALMSTSLKSDRMKATLLKIAGSDTDSPDVKAAALNALERFPLSQAEYALHSRFSATVAAGLAGNGVQPPSQPNADPGGAVFFPFQR